MIYQLVNMKLKFYRLYPPSTVHNPFLPTVKSSLCTASFFMPRFKAMVFIKIGLKLSPFCKTYKNFKWLGALSPDLRWHLAEGSAIRSRIKPLIKDFWLRAKLRYFNDTTLVCWCFCEFQILSKYRNITNNLKTHQNIITNFGRIVRFWKWHYLIFIKNKKYFKPNCVCQN